MQKDASPPRILSAELVAEAREASALPPEGPPEVAVAGRSNAGKSTLVNRLAGRRGLARTSKSPGRTRGLLFYDLRLAGRAPLVRLVDLPGYGYAQVSRAERAAWRQLVEGYVRARRTLALFLALADSRRGLAEEAELVEWLRALRIPHLAVLTKIDKLRARERGLLRQASPAAVQVSGETGEGVGALWSSILASLPAVPASVAGGAAPA